MATVDGKKTGGRVKGSVDRRLEILPAAQAIAAKLGINPLEVLLLFSANRWKDLGYDSGTKIRFSQSGEPIEVDRIETSERIAASSKACEYLFPKRKAHEFHDPNGTAANTLTEIFKRIADSK